jgi:hypothetical protein
MSTIVTRAGKGSPLTHTEVDNNFTNLNTDKIQSGNTVAALTITALTTPSVQAASSAGLALKNSAGTTQISMGGGGGDNVTIAVATNINGANAQIDISPTGTGHVHIKPTGTGSLEIAPTNVGTIDNMTIGATTARAITGTTITATSFVGSGASLTNVVNSLTASTGISVSGSTGAVTVTNTAPDQTVAIASGTGISVTGTYPNFTVTNTSPSSGGTVTSVTGTAPIVSSGGNTPAISISQSTTSTDGYLSSTDWTTFNNKYSTGGALGTPSSGTVTNLTGTASININGTVGATTANTGAFTTLSATGVTTVAAGSVSAPAITTTGDTNTGIFFPAADTIAFTEGGTESMRIDSSGNVGIGTTSPQNQFHINGTTTGYARFQSTNRTFTLGSLSSDFSFVINDVDASAERMRIDASGVAMFNTTTQLIRGGETFRVNGGTGIAAFKSNVSGPVIAMQNTVGVSTYQVGFSNSVGECGTITTGSNTVGYNSNSDYRLKENIAPMTGALAKVSALKPVTYKWKSDGLNGQGFIAHELQEVVPDCVTGEKDAVDAEGNPKYQGIDTSFLVATLTAAIQEQTAIITDLKSRIEALEVK